MNDDKGYWWETVLAILIPLVFAYLYALPCIIHKRTIGWYGAPPRTGDEAVRFGWGLMGLFLLFHAWTMPAYRRLPVLRWFLIIIGGLAFLWLGIVWDIWRLLCSG